MVNRSNFLTVTIATCTAGYLAGTLGFVAQNDLGFSTDHICSVALASAAVIASVLAIDHFGKKWRKERGDRH
jgi:hypothetical protein